MSFLDDTDMALDEAVKKITLEEKSIISGKDINEFLSTGKTTCDIELVYNKISEGELTKDIINKLKKSGWDINGKSSKYCDMLSKEFINAKICTPLEKACYLTENENINILLNEGANPNIFGFAYPVQILFNSHSFDIYKVNKCLRTLLIKRSNDIKASIL